MFRFFLSLIFMVSALASFPQKAKKANPSIVYYPKKEWIHKKPEDVGVNSGKLKEALDFAIANEVKNPRSMEQNHYQTFGREPFGDAIGPMKDRGESTGIIVKNGYIISEWGDPNRVDMTHSITKSFLSTVVGLAYDRGLIKGITDTMRHYIPPIQLYSSTPAENKADEFGRQRLLSIFETEHNRTITWNDMLRQTSDWEGTLWGKPDWADRPSATPSEWLTRSRNKPGSVYEYNDVRVNVLALATLNVWRRPLPQVLKENIMDPIGASSTWRWYGYENSWVVMDGTIVQSVSGGGHWGGGMIINAYDMARFGYLTLRHGKWKDSQLISNQWVEWALTPTAAEPTYGFMNWFLNTDKKYLPSAPASAFTHIGNGTNMIYVDPEHYLVAVARWIDSKSLNEFIEKLLSSIDQSSK
jgi:CubicO group peptidase (beta-lactamase class C family)